MLCARGQDYSKSRRTGVVLAPSALVGHYSFHIFTWDSDISSCQEAQDRGIQFYSWVPSSGRPPTPPSRTETSNNVSSRLLPLSIKLRALTLLSLLSALFHQLLKGESLTACGHLAAEVALHGLRTWHVQALGAVDGVAGLAKLHGAFLVGVGDTVGSVDSVTLDLDGGKSTLLLNLSASHRVCGADQISR